MPITKTSSIRTLTITGPVHIRLFRQMKKKKIYNLYQTPYDHLKSLPNAKTFLKNGVTFEQLDKIAYSHSDNEFATIMREEERKLFQKIRNHDKQDGSQRKT